MARSDGRIQPGQKLATAISARAWNRAQEAADIVLGERVRFDAETTATDRAQNIAIVRNLSGVQVPIMGVLAISGVALSPVGGTLSGTNDASSRSRELVRRPVLTGQRPSSSNVTHIAIALEPVADGAIGRFSIGGVVACKVKILSEQHKYARGRVDDVTQLVSAGCGPVKLLWKESTPGEDKWAVGVL